MRGTGSPLCRSGHSACSDQAYLVSSQPSTFPPLSPEGHSKNGPLFEFHPLSRTLQVRTEELGRVAANANPIPAERSGSGQKRTPPTGVGKIQDCISSF